MEELRDENGFIKLDDSMIRDYPVFPIKINDKKYYFKRFLPIDEESSVYDELIADELAKCYGINHVHYDIAVCNNIDGVISEDFIKDNNYITMKEILTNVYGESEEKNTLEDIWNALEQYKINNRNLTSAEVKYLMDKIVDIFMFDILIGNTDRNTENYGFLIKDNNIDIAPIFDNEFILDTCYTGDYGFTLYVDHDSEDYDDVKQSSYFFRISSSEYLDRFKEKLWIIDEENIENVFNRVEKRTKSKIEEKIKNRHRRDFNIIREKINSILENKKTL